MKQYLFFILYDSVTNSVFDSQVAEPLLKKQRETISLDVVIISFEKDVSSKSINSVTQIYPTLKFIFLKRRKFVAAIFLYKEIQQLKSILSCYTNYIIIARGPLAGHISLYAALYNACRHITIQTRGLLAEEYRYTHAQTKNIIMKFVHMLRTMLYNNIEKSVYSTRDYAIPLTIETVSAALKDYLITSYKACETIISVATYDIPQVIPQETVHEWRISLRTQLMIPENAYVYCYNGSLKPWQCPHQTILFFKEQLQCNNMAYLLILTPDVPAFHALAQQYLLPTSRYTILNVAHKDIYRFLAIADVGIIFREKNIINWTSRPTKILEYQAVGLTIVHNNTIALLHGS